jgi:hypothetical protein
MEMTKQIVSFSKSSWDFESILDSVGNRKRRYHDILFYAIISSLHNITKQHRERKWDWILDWIGGKKPSSAAKTKDDGIVDPTSKAETNSILYQELKDKIKQNFVNNFPALVGRNITE